MSDVPLLLADSLSAYGRPSGEVQVSLSNELVQLLSEQLYQSPAKAIEELVVNSYDADATECRIYVPRQGELMRRHVLVYDNGVGMDWEGLINLWHVGHSNKRDALVESSFRRKQIGKFGIGKLATYAIANKVTYLSRRNGNILGVTLDFRTFSSNPEGPANRVELPIRHVTDWRLLREDVTFLSACAALSVNTSSLFADDTPAWTLSILEDLKDKANSIHFGRLRWVLRTAMPLISDFRLFLNGDGIESSKVKHDTIASFDVTKLPQSRLDDLKESTDEEWKVVGERLVADSFPSGVTGAAIVTKQTLQGKSEDLGRSYGFFINVRERLINEDDPLMGLSPRSHETLNRFRADLKADDLDEAITAPREGIRESELRRKFQALLLEIFNEARSLYVKWEGSQQSSEETKKEYERSYVSPALVERPTADVLANFGYGMAGPEADESWFYLRLTDGTDISSLVRSLYLEPRSRYRYVEAHSGNSARIVMFDPADSVFYINLDHDLAKAYSGNGIAWSLLQDMVTAEALLEVYLREQNIPAHTVGAVLERRDVLLRSLAKDHPFSVVALSTALRDSAASEHDLELALVAALRALGFVANHISGSNEPDGLARFLDYRSGERKITLEAKSSGKVPSLSAIDFSGLQEHMLRHAANGCLLIAPSYPGGSREEDSAAAVRARSLRISCWTVEQLARVVASAEVRQLTARHILDIVLSSFSPDQVTEAIGRLFENPSWDARSLYVGVLTALRGLENRLRDSPRTVDMIAGEVSRSLEFGGVGLDDVERAVGELAKSSQGLLTLSGRTVLIHGSLDEVERRLSGLTAQPGEPRRPSTFRES